MLEWNTLSLRQRASVICLLGFVLAYVQITLPFILALTDVAAMLQSLCELLGCIALFSALAFDPMIARGQLLQLRPSRMPPLCKGLWITVILLFGLGNLVRIIGGP
ncbi:hypothetical protein [Pseudomonas sp. TUM22785]|uniref:hypothetical protein n=1 Tax=Pseudomonas sp. TUM22785 TaxID=3019098 RepID=UPI002304D79A|nr:hypothetical protein [Pseudomonas sp. TUM22785]WCD79778.1 hypothetical protein PI990_27960 [Pseudomonas sp. TUM22785]